VARQTRQQRKERREQQLADAAASQRGRARQPAQARPAPDAAPPAVEAAPARRRGSFIAESWAELRKVEWPNQRQVMQGTVVVLIACFVVGFYLWGADLVLKRFVHDVLLGQ
jgi:preprotein translocase subunit SecE